MKMWFTSIWHRIAAISNRLRSGTKNAPGTGSGVRTSGELQRHSGNTGDLPRSVSPSYAGVHRGSGESEATPYGAHGRALIENGGSQGLINDGRWMEF